MTRIINAEITVILDEVATPSSREKREDIAKEIKAALGADDVHVTKVKDFATDM